MDDRALYETILGLKFPWYVSKVEVRAGEEEVWVWVDPSADAEFLCPECGARSAGYDRSDERRWRHLDTCQFQTILVSRVPRVRCEAHGVRQVKVPWAEERGRFTLLFEAWAIRLLEETTVLGTAHLLGISWNEASGIFRRAVSRGLLRREDEPLRVLGIDETSFQKRHDYVTVVADLERDRVLWVGEARRQASMEKYWRSRPESELKELDAIVMDMWDPYIAATNAMTEGLNSKIQELKYRARGYRNRENFRLAILFHCGKLNMNPL